MHTHAKLTLGTVRVGPSISHGQVHRSLMLELEVLILELFSVDRFPAHSISHREVSALDHLLVLAFGMSDKKERNP